jgi:maltose alpha-D-glucosyltransferase / alpha-amylase
MPGPLSLSTRSTAATTKQAPPSKSFSEALPERLYLQPIRSGPYSYHKVNVAAMRANQQSLLNWMRRALSIRRNQRAFGRGELAILPSPETILAYVRSLPREVVAVVNNLSPQEEIVSFALDDVASSCSWLRGAAVLHATDLFTRRRILLSEAAPMRLRLPPHGHVWLSVKPATR